MRSLLANSAPQMTVDLAAELGSVLTSRSIGQQVRERITSAAAAGEGVVVSFAGVEAMSPSFADEIFAKVDDSLVQQGLIEFVDVDPTLEAIIRFVRAGRTSQAAG